MLSPRERKKERLLCAGFREYCDGQTFSATCYQPDEVVTITHAHYGLMSHGRCFDIQYSDVGCYADVIGHLAGVCSGRRACELEVNSLKADGCSADFPFFLNASYSCVKGIQRHFADLLPILLQSLTQLSTFVLRAIFLECCR